MISLQGVGKRFGKMVLFENLDFFPSRGSVSCLIGPSGCGKTTMLNLMAGLLQADTGKLEVEGRLSYVFQEARLLPWMSVKENAAYAMDTHIQKKERLERTDVMLDLLELKDAASLLPGEISGGMSHRTALARALLAPHEVLFLDEPLSSLDPEMRNRIIQRLPGLLKGKTVVLVTHDYSTAAALSDSVYLLSLPPVSIRTVDKNDIEGALRHIERINQEHNISLNM